MLAERADIYDVGVVQQVLPGLEVGIDGYYKRAKNLIDDGQFGQAFVLTAFNYAKGENVGVELSAKYKRDSFQAYANLAWARQLATITVSNQFLFDNSTPLPDLGGLTEFQYLLTHWVFTDHSQFWTGSAGFAYQFQSNWFFNLDVRYLWIDNDVRFNRTGANASSLDLDPWVFGVGIRHRF